MSLSGEETSATVALPEILRNARRLVLVANSDTVDIAALRLQAAPDTAFVFFNKVYKVLDAPFDAPCILLARSSPAGANIVYRREVSAVTRLLAGEHFAGILNLRADGTERFSPADAFEGHSVSFLDLSNAFAGFYPPGHVPTSGFALALHLIEVLPETDIVLAGFSARRSASWKLFHDHDWTFEQIVLRLLHRQRRLTMVQATEGGGAGTPEAIARRFPGIETGDIALVANEVLAERLEGANIEIDGLLSRTRLLARLDSLVRGLRPRTRKQRLAEREG